MPAMGVDPYGYERGFGYLFIVPATYGVPCSYFFIMVFVVVMFTVFVGPVDPAVTVGEWRPDFVVLLTGSTSYGYT